MINFFSTKKKFRPTSQNGRFPILRPKLRPVSGIENFFSQNLTYSYTFLGWNLPGITVPLESLHNYFGITVKSTKTDKKIRFFDFCLWCRNNVGIIATLRWSPVNFTTKKHYEQLFFPQKKKFRPTSQNGGFPILRQNLRPLLGIEIFFSQNLTYSYSFLGWNLPGITVPSESLHNFLWIAVKS